MLLGPTLHFQAKPFWPEIQQQREADEVGTAASHMAPAGTKASAAVAPRQTHRQTNLARGLINNANKERWLVL